MNEGWICPRYGRVNAPFIAYCDCKSNDINIFNATCKHQWVCDGVSIAGTHYICKICGKTKTEIYNPEHYGFTISG